MRGPDTTKGLENAGERDVAGSTVADFERHIWSSLNQIFERLGIMDQKLSRLATDQDKLRDTVEEHDKLIVRAVCGSGGAIFVISALWFLYEHFLSAHVAFR